MSPKTAPFKMDGGGDRSGNAVYGELLGQVGLAQGAAAWLRVSGDRSPTLQELRDGLRG